MAKTRYVSNEYKYYLENKGEAKRALKKIYDRVHMADYITMAEIDDILFFQNYNSVRECTRLEKEIDFDDCGFYDDVYDKVFVEEEGPESIFGHWSIVVMNPRPLVFYIDDPRRS